ncbi:MAG: DNA polymerase III subunit gamma/tau [Bacilli bacterium]|nr:DNA polymerase III subunit gamma/tau [Bacilli bacterium]
MYQALYRKYRPKTLEEICGQKTIVRILKNTIKNDQINHAYLFTGPRGTGKTSIAKILAKIVNCENLENLEPCGKCANCTQTNNSDIIEIDAASNNGVDEIRELRNKVNLVPSYGKYKIYIIDEVHMLTVGAFNALLKTLEEPPAHVIFILATTDPQKIPETILSRCQRFDFKKITNEEIVENLERISKKEKIDIEKDALYEIARLSDGGMRDSIGMLDQVKSYTDEKITVEDIHDINGTITEKDLEDLEEAIIEQKLEKILEKTDLYNEKGKNFTKLIEEMINFIRNIILYKKIPKYLEKIHKNVENLEKISKKIEINELLRQIEILNKYSFEMKTTNNSKLMFELAMIQIVNTEENAILSKQEQNSAKEKEKENTIIKNDEVKEESKIIVPPKEKNEKLEKLKEIRINNTLSKFNKKETIRVKKEIEKSLHELLINQLYSKAAAMIIDGELKAASETNLIFVYDNSRISNLFNESLIKLENTIEEAINTKYNLIAVDKEEWEKIKEEFNNKKREFKYQEEQIKLEEILKDNEQDILKMFEDIIEYK